MPPMSPIPPRHNYSAVVSDGNITDAQCLSCNTDATPVTYTSGETVYYSSPSSHFNNLVSSFIHLLLCVADGPGYSVTRTTRCLFRRAHSCIARHMSACYSQLESILTWRAAQRSARARVRIFWLFFRLTDERSLTLSQHVRFLALS